VSAWRKFHQEVVEEQENLLVEKRWKVVRLVNLSLQLVKVIVLLACQY